VFEPGLVAMALYGSAVTSGLRPNSDVDLLVVLRGAMSAAERSALVAGLLAISGRRHEDPDAARPLEVTVLAEPEIRPWRYPARFELQFGEWLRRGLEAGEPDGGPTVNPDVALLIQTVRAGAVDLAGSGVGEALPEVPWRDIEAAIADGVDGMFIDFDNDATNYLLTIARMWSTLETRTIRSKDAAADWVLERLPETDPARPPLVEARRRYLEGDYTRWDPTALVAARAAAEAFATQVRRLTTRGTVNTS